MLPELYCNCECHQPDPVFRTDPINAVTACARCAFNHPALNRPAPTERIEPTVWDPTEGEGKEKEKGA